MEVTEDKNHPLNMNLHYGLVIIYCGILHGAAMLLELSTGQFIG